MEYVHRAWREHASIQNVAHNCRRNRAVISRDHAIAIASTSMKKEEAHGSRLNLDRATREKVRVRTQGLQPPSKPKWLRCATCMPDEALPTQGDLGDAHTCTEAAS